MQAQAKGGAVGFEGVGQCACQQLRVTHLDGDDDLRVLFQRILHRRQQQTQALQQQVLLAQPGPEQGAELKHQHTEFVAQTFQCGLHKMLAARRGSRKAGLLLAGLAVFAAYLGIGHACRAFDDKAKVGIDLGGKGRVLAGCQWPPEGAVDTNAAQQGCWW